MEGVSMLPEDDIEKRLSELSCAIKQTSDKVDKIYVALFGVEGAGGLHRWVKDINVKLDQLDKDVTLERGKMLGIAVGISGFISLAGFIASKLIK